MVCHLHLQGRRDACEMQLALQSWWRSWQVSLHRQHLTKLHSVVSQTAVTAVLFAVREKNLAKVRHTPEEWVFLYHILLHSSPPHKHSPILSLTLSLLFSIIHLHILFLSPKWPCFRCTCPPKPSYCLYAEILHLLIPEFILSYSSLNDPQHICM